MTELELTQAEADELLATPKVKADDVLYEYPGTGGNLTIPLTSRDEREHFLLDISRAMINLKKCKYQNRAKQVIVLARLELHGPLHRNPDGGEVPCPHIHLYREGYADKWAYPLPAEKFRNSDDAWEALGDFMNFCSIVEPPNIERGLFT